MRVACIAHIAIIGKGACTELPVTSPVLCPDLQGAPIPHYPTTPPVSSPTGPLSCHTPPRLPYSLSRHIPPTCPPVAHSRSKVSQGLSQSIPLRWPEVLGQPSIHPPASCPNPLPRHPTHLPPVAHSRFKVRQDLSQCIPLRWPEVPGQHTEPGAT